jgi:hypothetical protein
MSARDVALRVPAWRSFVWAGVVASVVAWTWAWYVGRGAQTFMVVVALATVLFAYKAMQGMRVAFVGLMVAGFAMFLASVYWMFGVMMPAGPTSAFDMLSLSLFPMIASGVLIVGAAAGFRHVSDK